MELVFASHSHLSALGPELGDTIQNAIAAPAINFSTANIDSFLTAFPSRRWHPLPNYQARPVSTQL